MRRIKQTHALKLDMHFANAVKRGDKCFEIRKNDRGFQQGDTVIFQVVNKDGKAAYPHPEMSPLYGKLYEITYVRKWVCRTTARLAVTEPGNTSTRLTDTARGAGREWMNRMVINEAGRTDERP